MPPRINMALRLILLIILSLTVVSFPASANDTTTTTLSSTKAAVIGKGYPKPWDGALCFNDIYIEQHCVNGGQGSKSRVETYVRFVIKDNSWNNIEGLTGDIGYPDPVNVATVPSGGVGEIRGPFDFYMRWKWYTWSNHGQTRDKMTFHAPRNGTPTSTEDISCGDCFWSEDTGNGSHPGFFDHCFNWKEFDGKKRHKECICNFDCYPACGNRDCHVVPPY